MTVLPTHTSSSQSGGAEYPEALGLTEVLTSSLPPTLGTAGGPQTYQVDAVFSRRPLAEEVAALHSAATKAALDGAGYPSVTVRVSDRRLEIAGTTLEQLEGGLATFLADHLAALTAEIWRDRENTRVHAEEAARVEDDRTEAVTERAKRIQFTRSGSASANEPESHPAPSRA
ncbi:hypothetical protein CH252_24800 [Rhodococcus sp. 06-1477-1B]|nr:hypothetical protein CH252_24800 [Rhodococcus sp. 06-1477-1B]